MQMGCAITLGGFRFLSVVLRLDISEWQWKSLSYLYYFNRNMLVITSNQANEGICILSQNSISRMLMTC